MSKAAIVAGVVIAAGAVWTGSSWYLGTQIQERLDDYLVKTNDYLKKEGEGRISVEAVSYDKGVFSSDAVYTVNMTFPEMSALPQEVLLNSHIEHGPISLSALLRGEFVTGYATASTTLVNDEKTKPLYDAAGGKEPYAQSDRIDFSGNVHSIAKLEALDATFGKTVVKSQPVTATTFVNKDFTKVDMTFDMPGATQLNYADVDFSLENVTGQGSSSKTASGLFVGPAVLNIGRLEIKRKNDKTLSIADFKVDVKTEEVDDFLNLNVGYDLGNILVNDVDFGAIKLNVAFDHLDRQAVEKFRQQAGSLNLTPENIEQQGEQIEQYYAELFTTLIRQKLQVRVSPFSWKTVNGEGSLEASANFDGAGQPEGQTMEDSQFLAESLKKVQFALKADTHLIRDVVSGSAQVSGVKDKEAADKKGDDLASMAGLMAQMSGLGKLENDVISSDIAYDSAMKPEEQITLNAEKMSLQELAAKAGSAVSGTPR
ncbi:YdgA family protein [Advenella sp. FME57]|uniref:YdgA family protein n=1 Tax=Advenella sp. FME57 TaxID=2742604 RepID=UPI0018672A54|nr:YdgA family protein [Advenella sp. FME57]